MILRELRTADIPSLIGPNPAWQACAARFLDGLATTGGERYYGLYVRRFTTGLAWLSSVTGAEQCRSHTGARPGGCP